MAWSFASTVKPLQSCLTNVGKVLVYSLVRGAKLISLGSLVYSSTGMNCTRRYRYIAFRKAMATTVKIMLVTLGFLPSYVCLKKGSGGIDSF